LDITEIPVYLPVSIYYQVKVIMSTTTTTTTTATTTTTIPLSQPQDQPAAASEPEFKLITVRPLHATFGAEVTGGIDFSKPVPDDIFQEVLAAITKVNPHF
jgi:hypothetical protein